jgi:hypothetical protein
VGSIPAGNGLIRQFETEADRSAFAFLILLRTRLLLFGNRNWLPCGANWVANPIFENLKFDADRGLWQMGLASPLLP